jgi:hypothetical protein
MKKLVSVLLAMVLALSLFSVTASAASIVKTGTYVTDEYDDDKYNSSVTINADKTFSMSINFGMGLVPITGTWGTSPMDGTTLINLNVQKDPRHQGLVIPETYYLAVSPRNNNHLYIPNGSSTMGVVPAETLFIYRGAAAR